MLIFKNLGSSEKERRQQRSFDQQQNNLLSQEGSRSVNPSTLVLKATLGSSRPDVANIDSQSERVYYFVWPVKKNLARN